ncbi:uncharacterized protein K441DRAFT_559759, partial [Cenococcum geophilum 1.58]|uniref:uncharacterized protein n=1 Tax=Cenococcum geophilum 1.58 TaxID=794803 RepID=UPI00358EFF9A
KTEELDLEVLQAVLNKEVINKALITLILEFYILLQLINPKVDGHITIAHLVVSKKIYNL